MPGPLVTVAELAGRLESTEPPTLLDVRWNLGADTGYGEYLAGHLPGAVWVDLDRDLASPPGDGGRHPLPAPADFQAAMRKAGVRTTRPVVAYDGANGMAAARLWWLLTDGGLSDVSVLTGGYAAWLSAGLPVEQGPVAADVGMSHSRPASARSSTSRGCARTWRVGEHSGTSAPPSGTAASPRPWILSQATSPALGTSRSTASPDRPGMHRPTPSRRISVRCRRATS